MSTKSIIRFVLLAVIAIAVGGWFMKEFGPANAANNATDREIRPDGVTVINFHGEKRCRTCISIGNLARKTLDEEFAAEEKAGKVRWQQINYDEPANASYVKKYELVSSTILLTLWKDGKEVKWNRLDAVWDHVGDEPVFRTYVAQAVSDLLKLP